MESVGFEKKETRRVKKETRRVCIYQRRMQHPEWMEYLVLCPGDGGARPPPAPSTIRQNSAPLPGLPGPALRTNLFLLPTNVSTNMMTEEERGEEILHYCCGDASIITGT